MEFTVFTNAGGFREFTGPSAYEVGPSNGCLYVIDGKTGQVITYGASAWASVQEWQREGEIVAPAGESPVAIAAEADEADEADEAPDLYLPPLAGTILPVPTLAEPGPVPFPAPTQAPSPALEVLAAAEEAAQAEPEPMPEPRKFDPLFDPLDSFAE